MNRQWLEQPSIELCAEQCGAGCCKNGFFFLTLKEMRQLKTINGEAKFINHEKGVWVLDHAFNGGQCPFLDTENRCSIYEQRPSACQRFPVKPYEGCLVWPIS